MQAGYFQTSWNDIKNSPGWFGKACLLALLMLIPIFGPMVALGYAFGWARDIAWNVRGPLPASIFGNEDGRLYSRGFFALVISLLFSIAPAIVYAIGGGLASATGRDAAALVAVGSIITIVGMLGMLFCMVLSWVGTMRMSIYGTLSSGLQLKKIWAMFTHDTHGIMRIFGMVLLVEFVLGAIFTIVFFVMFFVFFAAMFAPMLPTLTSGREPSSSAIMTMIASSGIFILLMFAICFFLEVFSIVALFLTARAMGYWTRQFDVAHWLGQDDPMPFEIAGPTSSAMQGYNASGQMDYAASAQAMPIQQTEAPYASAQQVNQAYASAPAYGQQNAAATAYPASAGVVGTAAQSGDAPYDTGAQNAAGQPGSAAPYAAVAQPASATASVDSYAQANASYGSEAPAADVWPIQSSQPVAATPIQADASFVPQSDSEKPARPVDMHHKFDIKPAAKWEKIDLDALDNPKE